jgi:hypothetical protein
MILATVRLYSVQRIFFAVLYILCIGLAPKSTIAQTLEVSGGYGQKLYGRLSVGENKNPELLPTSNYKNYGYDSAKFMDGVALFVVGDQEGEYFFKTSQPSDIERFPIIFNIKNGLTEEIKLFWVNLTQNSATVENVLDLTIAEEDYHQQLGKITDRGETFEKLLADLTFKINELEANNSVAENIPDAAPAFKRNVEATNVGQSSVVTTETLNSGHETQNSSTGSMEAQQQIVPSVSTLNDVAHTLQFLLSNQELLNANMMLRMLAFLCGGLSLILLYFALVAKLARKPEDQSNAISQELQKRDIFESTILLRERNLYDRVAQIAQQTYASQPQAIAPSHDPKQVMRDMLEEYLRPLQVQQISPNENIETATNPKQQASQKKNQPIESESLAKKQNVDTAAKTEQRNPYVLNENQRKNQASQQKSEAVQSSAIPEDEVKKLQVATVYYNMGDLSMAKSLLKELEHSSFNKIKNDAKALLREIDR